MVVLIYIRLAKKIGTNAPTYFATASVMQKKQVLGLETLSV